MTPTQRLPYTSTVETQGPPDRIYPLVYPFFRPGVLELEIKLLGQRYTLKNMLTLHTNTYIKYTLYIDHKDLEGLELEILSISKQKKSSL